MLSKYWLSLNCHITTWDLGCFSLYCSTPYSLLLYPLCDWSGKAYNMNRSLRKLDVFKWGVNHVVWNLASFTWVNLANILTCTDNFSATDRKSPELLERVPQPSWGHKFILTINYNTLRSLSSSSFAQVQNDEAWEPYGHRLEGRLSCLIAQSEDTFSLCLAHFLWRPLVGLYYLGLSQGKSHLYIVCLELGRLCVIFKTLESFHYLKRSFRKAGLGELAICQIFPLLSNLGFWPFPQAYSQEASSPTCQAPVVFQRARNS